MTKSKAKNRKRAAAVACAAPCYAPIIVLPMNTALETVAEIRAAGYVPVCCDDPAKVVTVYPEVSGGDMLMAALHGIANGSHMDDVRSKMVLELHKRLLKHEGRKKLTNETKT